MFMMIVLRSEVKGLVIVSSQYIWMGFDQMQLSIYFNMLRLEYTDDLEDGYYDEFRILEQIDNNERTTLLVN